MTSRTSIILFLIALGLGVAALVMIFIRSEKWTNIKYRKSLAAIILAAALAGGATIGLENSGTISSFFGNLNYAYRDYGMPYCFIATSVNAGIARPKGYSEEMIAGLLDEKTKRGTDTKLEEKEDSTQHPNIIVLQMESFTVAQDYAHKTRRRYSTIFMKTTHREPLRYLPAARVRPTRNSRC